MGICGSSSKKHVDEDAIDQGRHNNKLPRLISTAEDLKLGAGNLVFENKNKISKEYNILWPPLGQGAFGEVRKCVQRETGQVRAVKIIFKDNATEEELKRILREVEILKRLDHPNIIKVHEFFQDDKHFFIVTELCNGGELFDRIIKSHHFSERKAAETMEQILSAIVYCHDRQIVHRDLKPENVLYESPKPDSPIKVIDFGTSRVFDKDSSNNKMMQKLGTPYYIAPEVLKKQYDEKCDVWSCGVILYILLSGSPPFGGKTDEEIMKKVEKGNYSLSREEFKDVSPEAKNLIKKMLEYAPEKRVSAKQALADIWFQNSLKKDKEAVALSTTALQNLKKLTYKSKLQQIVYYFIVNHMTTKEERNDLMRVFKILDKNSDGRLTKEELLEGYNKSIPMNDLEIDDLMKKLDNDGSGSIDYTEFVAAAMDKEKVLTKKRIEACFLLFDKDKSGSISKTELKQMLGGSENISEDVWLELIKEVDGNGDGEIGFNEFRDMLVKMVS
jgi:calcium-dependent protein kinase